MRKALIVGIDDYPIAPLKGCINDASAVATLLETHADGSANFGIRLCTDLKTKAELKRLIIELFKDKNDLALFYFSGHGCFTDLGGYIVTPDYKKYDEGISMDEILVILNESPAKDKIVILDCCHSGELGTPKIGKGMAQITEGVTVLTASRGTESAMEINGHGVFTNLLLDGLRGGAADLSGTISPGSIYAHIDKALGPWEQRPVFKTNVTRFTSLRNAIPPISLDVLKKLAEYFEEPNKELPLDPSFEDTTEKADEKKVAIFKNLQKLVSVGLVKPEGEEHMYYAAMNSKSCKLTALGCHYWRLVKDKRI